MAQTTVQFRPRLAARTRLERRAKLLAHLGNGWHLVEFGIALGAGVAAGSVLLVAYIVSHALYDLVAGSRPSASWVGVGLAAVTAPTMPLLARAKRTVGRALDSSATVSEAGQNQICAYLSLALLAGLLLNATAGWWWADPAAAIVIAAFALHEGRETWRGNACDCC